MTSKELREKRATLAKQIRALADRQAQWTDADRAEWKAVNERYDALTEQITVAERTDGIDEEMRATAGDERIGRHDPLADRPDVRRQLYGDDAPAEKQDELRFLDANGRAVRAVGSRKSVLASQYRDFDPAPRGAFGRFVVASLTGRFDALPENEQRAFQSGTSLGDGAYLLNPILSAQIVDLARAQSVAMRAGVKTVAIDGETRLATVTRDPVAHWRGEGVAVPSTSVEFGRITLVPKTLACIVPASIELLEDAANAADVISATIARAMALKLDQAILDGAGDDEDEPLGIRGTTGVHAVAASGAYLTYSQVRTALLELLNSNCPTPAAEMALITSPRDMATLDGLLTGEGDWLRAPEMLAPIQRLATTSIPVTEDPGDRSFALLGDFNQVVVGLRRGITVRLLDAGTVDDEEDTTYSAASQLLRLIVVYMRADVAVLQPTWLSRIEGIGPFAEATTTTTGA